MKKRDVYIICALLYAICILPVIIMVLQSAEEPQSEENTETVQVATDAEKEPETTTERATVTTERPTEIRTEEPTTQRKTEMQTEKQTEEPTTQESTGEINADGYGWIELQYSAPYHVTENHLTRSNGSIRYNGHRETWYSIHEPGQTVTAWEIPGKHIADDGTIRDEDGFVCVASSDHRRHTIILTSVGPGKVYDCGCSRGDGGCIYELVGGNMEHERSKLF